MGHNYTEETDRSINKNRHDTEGAIIVSMYLSILYLTGIQRVYIQKVTEVQKWLDHELSGIHKEIIETANQ